MTREHTSRVLALVLTCLIVGAGVAPAGAAGAETAGAGNTSAADRTAAPALNATGAWGQGYTGDNVTVAVVDDEFDADHPTVADNVVATWTRGDTNGDFDAPKGHGTNVSAMVLQTAPDADLALYDPGGTSTALAETLREAGSEADVVVTAYGEHFDRPLDGSSEAARAASDVADNGTTVVVAAGNYGRTPIYHTTWNDPDDDGWHEFPDGEERLRTEMVSIVKYQWSDWDTIDSDYDVHVYDAEGTEIDAETADQRQERHPSDSVFFGSEDVDVADVKIKGYDPDPEDRLTLRFEPNFLAETEYGDRSQTLISYAAAEDAIAVGAYDVGSEKLAPYSSRGPTLDGRTKPDVLGGANLSAPAGGHFGGTSAAAPTVAGVVATMEQANGSLTPERTAAILESTAQPVSGDEPNNRTGHGLVDAGEAVAMAEPDPAVAPIDGTLPQDPNGDGLYEDVNADGAVTEADVDLFFEHMLDDAVQNNVAAFDFSGNGEVGHGDVVALHDIATEPALPPVNGTVPTDPDGDGLYEDLNGDGAMTDADVDVFFEHMRDDAIQDNVDAYDFSGDGDIGHGDVVELYNEAT